MYKYNHKVIGSNEGFWMIMIKSNIACTTRGILAKNRINKPHLKKTKESEVFSRACIIHSHHLSISTGVLS